MTYYVYENPNNPGESPVIIHDGFNLWGFLLSPFWALYHSLWFFSAFIFFMEYGFVFLDRMAFFGAFIPLAKILFKLFIGLYANEILAKNYEKRGYKLVELIVAPNADKALQRFLDIKLYKEQS
jgi:hypothetical protein